MKQIVTIGIVLARTNYGEADRIITVLTRDQGKIRLLAKGVRKIKSRLAGGIELFSSNDITYIVGRGELGTLVSARLEKNYGTIVKDVERTMCTYDVLKLINKVTEDSPEPEYYLILKATLAGINKSTIHLDYIKLWFYTHLLKLSGHSPNLHSDTSGAKLEQTQAYTLSFEEMTFCPHPSGPFNAGHIKVLRLAYGADSPAKLAHVKQIDAILPSLVQLTKTMLQQHTNIR